MNPNYQHTQVGWVNICGMLGIGFFILALTQAPGGQNGREIAWGAAAVLIAVGVLFGTLTIEVGAEVLSWRFGPGLFRKSVSLREIEGVAVVRNGWGHGRGIHYTMHGWVYNVAGFEAIEVRMKDGKRFRLGTDQPQQLARAIEDALRLQALN